MDSQWAFFNTISVRDTTNFAITAEYSCNPVIRYLIAYIIFNINIERVDQFLSFFI